MKFSILLVLFSSFLFGAININSANVRELSSLKGISMQTAQAIYIYRKKHCFTSVDELLKVKRFTKKALQRNRKNIIVSKCKK